MSTVTDPIADFLARVRNGTRAQKPEVLVPYSKVKAEIARILKDEGYISDYSIDTSAAHPRIKITNKIVNRSSAIAGLRRVSRPGLRRYVGADEIPEFWVEWVWRFFPRHAAFYRDAKRGSKKWAANYWPTFGNHLTNHELMSRIGNKAVEIPDKVKVNVDQEGAVSVEGPKGKTAVETSASDPGQRAG